MADLPSWLENAQATSGSFEGEAHGGEVSLFVVDAATGEGARLHTHPYSERLKLVAIHAAPRMETTWLED